MFDSSLVNRFVLANGNSFNETEVLFFSIQHKNAHTNTSNEQTNELTLQRSKMNEMRFASLRVFFSLFFCLFSFINTLLTLAILLFWSNA